MKLIIDIPDEVYNRIKNIIDEMCNIVWLAIKNGIPLEDIASRIEAEKNKLNAEGDFVYSVSEIKVFDKCLEIIKGEE